jgi:hypothetical protein
MKVLISKVENEERVRGGSNKIGQVIEITQEKVKESLGKLVEEVSGAVDSIKTKSENYSIDTVEVSLAISAEGNIYVASAGAEASITLTSQNNN